MSNSYLLSSSPVGKVCSDPALLFIIHCIYYEQRAGNVIQKVTNDKYEGAEVG